MWKMERETGFEPATVTLARWGSTGLSYSRSQLWTTMLPVGKPAETRYGRSCPQIKILGRRGRRVKHETHRLQDHSRPWHPPPHPPYPGGG